jgi:hypothetical protein
MLTNTLLTVLVRRGRRRLAVGGARHADGCKSAVPPPQRRW